MSWIDEAAEEIESRLEFHDNRLTEYIRDAIKGHFPKEVKEALEEAREYMDLEGRSEEGMNTITKALKLLEDVK